MENTSERDNLSSFGIYDLLKVKNRKKFHLTESRKNIVKSIELLKIAQCDLLSTPFGKNKRANKAIIIEVAKQLDNLSWNLLSLSEGIAQLETLRQNAGYLTNNALSQLLDELQNGIDII